MYDILVVDDDGQVLDMVDLILKREGYTVTRAYSANEAMAALDRTLPDMFIIDAMLPDMDGLSLCRRLRNNPATCNVPVIFMTGRDSSYSVADALNAGGDDYVRKPFAPRELTARIRAHIRRSYFLDADIPTIRIMPSAYRVFVNDREVALTRVEFDLLKYLCVSPYRLHSTDDLLANVWQYPNGVGDAALVRNHIHNLRQKLEHDPERPAVIQSRHGRGYVVKAHINVEDEVTTHA